MTWTCLIASADYIEPEMGAQFGRLPPAFLPIGNRRLFTHQHTRLSAQINRTILSLPEDFEPDEADLLLLHDLGIEVVRVPGGLSLGQSIVYVINVTASSAGRFSILHGDTLLEGVDFSITDAVSTGQAPSIYEWGVLRQKNDLLCEPLQSKTTAITDSTMPTGSPDQALSGWFSFADAALLIQAITRAGGSFIDGIGRYAGERPLRTISTTSWFDFGHTTTYHQSRRRITTERHFNRLEPTHRTVVKSGLNNNKIKAEGRWFEELPPEIRIHAPAFLGMSESAHGARYALEYLHLPTLADLFVFGRLPKARWRQIFESCDEFLSACARHPAPAESAGATSALYTEKTQERLQAFARARGLDLKASCRFGGAWLPSLERIADVAAAAIPEALPHHLTLVHGDFCFSNIFYDVRAELVRVIDPRGLDARGGFSAFGDLRYDLAKMHHSVIGRYDHIVAGYYRLQRQGPLDLSLELPDSALMRSIDAEFLGRRFANMAAHEAAAPAICILLFLSMLPLHAEDPNRQDAFLANALRLFQQLDGSHQTLRFSA